MLQKYKQIINDYRQNYDEDLEFLKAAVAESEGKYFAMERCMRNKTNRVLYGKGSDMLRGYFGPSLIEDIVVGGVHRGKLYSDKKKLKNIEAYYYFDGQDKLIGIRMEQIAQMEFIYYDGNVSKGFCFEPDEHKLRYVTKCEYDEQGRLKNYMTSNCEDIEEDMGDDYTKEIYLYNGERLSAVVVYDTPKTFEIPGFLLKQFANLIGKGESKENWWRKPEIYEFAYNADGRAIMYHSIDLETNERENYEISPKEALRIEETMKNLRCPR